MKITSLFVFAIAIICSNSYGWSGEGVPVISFKAGSYLLCESPKIDSTCKQKKIEIKKKIMLTDSDIISSSRIITISPVIMTATSDFLIKDSNTYIKKGEKLSNHGYIGEDYFDVEIKGKKQELDLYKYNKYLTNTDIHPETEWWINIINYGWLNLDLAKDKVTYYDRAF